MLLRLFIKWTFQGYKELVLKELVSYWRRSGVFVAYKKGPYSYPRTPCNNVKTSNFLGAAGDFDTGSGLCIGPMQLNVN